MSEPIFTNDVTDILDLVFARDGHEPDWAAVKTRLFAMEDSYFQTTLNLLRALWTVYEDTAAYDTLLYKLEHGD